MLAQPYDRSVNVRCSDDMQAPIPGKSLFVVMSAQDTETIKGFSDIYGPILGRSRFVVRIVTVALITCAVFDDTCVIT